MKRLIILLIFILAISSCQVFHPDADSPKLGNTKWRITSIKQRPTNLKDNGFITFDEKDGKIAGQAACNTFFGDYVIVRKTITFGSISSTEMFCEGLMDEEHQILSNLENVKRFEIKADMLYLYSSDELVLTFKR